MVSYQQFKEVYDSVSGEPEFEFYFDNRGEDSCWIIKYQDGPTFQGDGYGEIKFNDLDSLVRAVQPNGLCIQKDWPHIEAIIMNSTFNLMYENERTDAIEISRRFDGQR